MRETPWKKPFTPVAPAVLPKSNCGPNCEHVMPAPVEPKVLPPVSKNKSGQSWLGIEVDLLERIFTSKNGGLAACYATFGSERTRAAIRGKLQRLGLIPKRYVPSLNPS